MKRIRIEGERFDYPYDLDRIVQVFADRDIEISRDEAQILWQRYSDSMAAGWMGLPSADQDVYQSCAPYFEVVDDDPPF